MVTIESPHRKIPRRKTLKARKFFLPMQQPKSLRCASCSSMQISHQGQWYLFIFLETSMLLVRRQGSQISPIYQGLGLDMPGLSRAVTSQARSTKMVLKVRMIKKEVVSWRVLRRQRKMAVKRLRARKQAVRVRTMIRRKVQFGPRVRSGYPLLFLPRMGLYFPHLLYSLLRESLRYRVSFSFGDGCYWWLMACRRLNFRVIIPKSNCIQSTHIQAQGVQSNQPLISLQTVGKMVINTPQKGCMVEGNIIISFVPSGKQMLNFAVTGKKMGVTSFNQRIQNVDVPMMIQSKPITQKVYVAPKAKQQREVGRKLTQEKRSVPMKVEGKKEVAKKEESRVEGKEKAVKMEVKIEPAPVKQVQPVVPVQQPKKEDAIGQVIIRYNHYKDPFPSINGILSFLPIQQKYSFGQVFKGNFLPVLKNFKSNEVIEPQSTGKAVDFSWKVQENINYRLEIQQDEEQQCKREKKIYKAEERSLKHCPCNKKTRTFHELNEQLKKLDPSQYGGAKHRQLLQQRDLQDILYS